MIRTRTYLLAFRLGDGCWYYQVPQWRDAHNAIPMADTKDGLLRFVATVDATAPASERIPILDK